jgi:hypothetical protein
MGIVTAGPADRAAARTRLSPRVMAVVLAGLIVLLTAAIAVGAALGHQHQDDRTGLVLTLMLWIIAAVGLVVAWHQPGNAIGWLMLGAPVALLLTLDRRFNRARYDADAAVDAFATRLAGAVALPEVRADLLAVVAGALEPAHLAVWRADGER